MMKVSNEIDKQLPSIKDQCLLYKLICSQLQNDGLQNSARYLKSEINQKLGGWIGNDTQPDDRLLALLQMCMRIKNYLDVFYKEPTFSPYDSPKTMESGNSEGDMKEHVKPDSTSAEGSTSGTANKAMVFGDTGARLTSPTLELPLAAPLTPSPPQLLRASPIDGNIKMASSFTPVILSHSRSPPTPAPRIAQKVDSTPASVLDAMIPSLLPWGLQCQLFLNQLQQNSTTDTTSPLSLSPIPSVLPQSLNKGELLNIPKLIAQTSAPPVTLGHSKSPSYTVARKRFECSFCGRRFTQHSALQVHERTHTGEKPYRCQYCDKAFTQVSNLKCHERLHTGEKPYRCHLCGKRFTQSASLRCHIRSHTGERPYLCKYCHKRFTQPASLQHHIRIHTGEKPYKCEHCYKCFTQPSSLVVHRRLHTGERPFVCHVCGRSYTQAMPLKEHLRTHGIVGQVAGAQAGPGRTDGQITGDGDAQLETPAGPQDSTSPSETARTGQNNHEGYPNPFGIHELVFEKKTNKS